MKPGRIVVVEDEAFVAHPIEERLAALGYRVVGRSDTGEGALELACAERPDLFLMEIRLRGEMDGVEAALQIRRRYGIPVIFLTADSDDQTLERAKTAEPYGLILKPCDDRELRSAIEIALYKQSAEREIILLNRLYDVLRQVNQAVVRTRSRQELFDAVCRLLVERAGIDMAWIGLVDPAGSRITPVARFGARTDLLESAEFRTDAGPEGDGNPGKAARTGEHYICHDCCAQQCRYPLDWRPSSFGFASCGSFPIRFRGAVHAVLTLFIRQEGFFQERETELLDEVARDLSFALDQIENEERRREAESRLRRREQGYRRLFEQAAVGFAEVECGTGRFLNVNQRFAEITGRTVQELLATDFSSISHPDDAAGDAGMARQLARGELPEYSREKRYLKPDGSLVWVKLNVSLLREPGEAPTRHFAVVEEITQQKLAEELVRENEVRFKSLVEGAPESIFVQSEGRFVYVNPHFVRLMGGTAPDQLLGTRSLQRIAPEYREALRERLRQLDAGHESAPLTDLEYLRLDGTHVPAESTAVSIRFRGADAQLVFIRDVSERKRSEEALRGKDLMLARLASQTPGMLYLLMQRTDQRYCMPFASDAITGIFGCTPQQVLEDVAPLWSVVLPEDLPALVDSLEASARLLTPWQHEYRIQRPGEAVRWIWGQSLTVRQPDGSVVWYGFDSDITERKKQDEARKQAEDKLRQAQKMEAIGVLAGGIAHDFNNILAIIFGYTDLALLALEEGHPAAGHVGQVVQASLRAKELVQQILAFSRKGEKERRPVQLAQIAKEALKMLRASLPSSITITPGFASDAVIFGDPTRIHQVLMNLCTNAAHAMQERGGELGVSLSDVSLVSDAGSRHLELDPGNYVVLAVSDTGTGIDAAIMDRIFDPFFTTKQSGAGTGLGLSVVHGIVKDHGGEIEVASTPGLGTSFRLYFPVLERFDGAQPAPKAPLVKGEGRILVVDDEPELGRAMQQMLEQLGYTAALENDPGAALELFRKDLESDPFDLVLTDMTMPHQTGAELAVELLRLKPGLPVLLTTGYSERIDAEQANRLGIRALLEKPIGLRELSEQVKRHLPG